MFDTKDKAMEFMLHVLEKKNISGIDSIAEINKINECIPTAGSERYGDNLAVRVANYYTTYEPDNEFANNLFQSTLGDVDNGIKSEPLNIRKIDNKEDAIKFIKIVSLHNKISKTDRVSFLNKLIDKIPVNDLEKYGSCDEIRASNHYMNTNQNDSYIRGIYDNICNQRSNSNV